MFHPTVGDDVFEVTSGVSSSTLCVAFLAKNNLTFSTQTTRLIPNKLFFCSFLFQKEQVGLIVITS